MTKSISSKERAHQVALLLALNLQYDLSINEEEIDLLGGLIEYQRQIIIEADSLAKVFSELLDQNKTEPLENSPLPLSVMAVVDTEPKITIRNGFFGSKNTQAAYFRYPFGIVKVVLKHFLHEDEDYRITEDDLRFIPVIVREYWPCEHKKGTNRNGAKTEWRVIRGNRELVLVTEEENPRIIPGSDNETLVTFYVQNPRKRRKDKLLSIKK